MKIKELSKKTNLAISTIRYYEKLNLISPKKSGYYKDYTPAIEEQLFLIQKLHLTGLRLKDLQYLFSIQNKEQDKLSLSEISQIKDLLESSIRNIVIKQEQLKHSKDMLDKMLRKVNQLL